MIEVTSAMMCQITGIDPTNPNEKCLGVDPKTNKIGFVENGGGAIGLVNHMIVLTYTPPLHTGDYFSYLAQNFGIVKPAYAQITGSGFDGIKPLLGLWTAFRNFVYLLFVAVFVIIGFAIMLRVKIDPRTVMSISNQLPHIIIGILLVTFSFAISGLLIDIMWASIYVTYGAFASANVTGVNVSELNPTSMAGKNAFDAFGGVGNAISISYNLADSTKNVIRNLIGLDSQLGNYKDDTGLFEKAIKNGGGILGITPSMVSGASPGAFLINWAVTTVSFFTAISYAAKVAQIVGTWTIAGFSIPIGTGTSIISGLAIYETMQTTLRYLIPLLIPFIIIFTALLFALFRIWFQLIQAYISILIDVVLAPFWIVGGLLPGSPISFSLWLRDMFANLSVFPVTIGMFLLGKVFIDVFTAPGAGPFVPPLIGNFGDTKLFGAVIGLGIILLTPQVANMMRDLIKSPQFKYTAAIGQAVGVGTGVTNLPGHATTIGSTLFGLSHFPGAGSIPFVGGFIRRAGQGGGAPHT